MFQQTTPWSDTQKLLAIGLTVAFCAVIVVWMFFPPKGDQAATNILNTLVGSLGTLETMVVSFYFGTSRQSTTKDNTIAALANNNNPAPPSTPTG